MPSGAWSPGPAGWTTTRHPPGSWEALRRGVLHVPSDIGCPVFRPKHMTMVQQRGRGSHTPSQRATREAQNARPTGVCWDGCTRAGNTMGRARTAGTEPQRQKQTYATALKLPPLSPARASNPPTTHTLAAATSRPQTEEPSAKRKGASQISNRPTAPASRHPAREAHHEPY